MTGSAFLAGHLIALIGWVGLFVSPFNRLNLIPVARLAGLVLAGVYTAVFLSSLRDASLLVQDYSLQGIARFFSVPALGLAGWMHYLAFDLWVGAWEAEEANRIGMRPWLANGCLVLTFLLGPIGLLVFSLFRVPTLWTSARTKA